MRKRNDFNIYNEMFVKDKYLYFIAIYISTSPEFVMVDG